LVLALGRSFSSPAFILFLIVYAPMLWRARPGGKSG
jgi:hypothetical protein